MNLQELGFHKYASPMSYTMVGALAGASLITAQQIANMGKIIPEFEKEDYEISPEMQKRLDAEPIKIIKTVDEFKETPLYQKDMGFLEKRIVLSTIKNGNNAFFVLPKKYGEPIMVVPEGVKNKKVLLHEFGHYLDAKERDMLTHKKFTKYYGPTRSQFQALYKDPKKTPMYKAENEAWEQSTIPVGDPLRESALRSYELAIKGPRYVGGGAALGGIVDILRAIQTR